MEKLNHKWLLYERVKSKLSTGHLRWPLR